MEVLKITIDSILNELIDSLYAGNGMVVISVDENAQVFLIKEALKQAGIKPNIADRENGSVDFEFPLVEKLKEVAPSFYKRAVDLDTHNS